MIESGRSYWARILGKRTRRVNDSSKEQCRLQRGKDRSGLVPHGAGGRGSAKKWCQGGFLVGHEEKSEQQMVMAGG